MHEAILGISAYYHDSAAVLMIDGEIIAAAQEERFTRIKNDPSFPINAAKYVLFEGGIEYENLSSVAFYDKPYIKFERLLETYHAFAPFGLKSFITAIPVWIKDKLFLKRLLREELSKLGRGDVPLYFPEHHLSHAASAFYPSPFEEAAILTVDGVGEWATSTIGHGEDERIEILRELDFPHSIGLLYSAFTYYTGFKVNSGEYKLMGLAPYGNPDSEQTKGFKNKILDEIIDIRPDGSILLNMDYFYYATGLTMTCNRKWEKLFGIPKRQKESHITQDYMNLALAIQQITEEIMKRLAKTAKDLTGSRYLTLAGGVALNCVANGKLLAEGIFDDIWIQPAAGDAGGALGAAFSVWHIKKENKRLIDKGRDPMKGSYLGPEFSDKDTLRMANAFDAKFRFFHDTDELLKTAAGLLAKGCVIGWFQGRMEYGPRALGNRSILGDARNGEMQKKMNLKIKFREGFRPFAPSVLLEDVSEFFLLDRPSPYMLLVVPIRESRRNPLPEGYQDMPLYSRLYHHRSDLPAITHIDYSARIQSVDSKTNPLYWKLINAFKEITGYGVIINTSFNVRGEPIVCTPQDAYRCFMRTGLDYLIMGNYIFDKAEQPEFKEDFDWKKRFKLD